MLLVICAGLGVSWYHALRLREHAVALARSTCERHALQLLDDSVALHRLRMRWRRGALHILREYRFDVSEGGNDRRTASFTLLAGRVVAASLPARRAPPPTPPVSACAPQMTPRAPSPGGAGNNVVPITRGHRTLH
ncbi:MAG: DUF3301 domain-containing protein [Rhodanobacteraceae bacterium]|nr:MAG: DUF3301 domain-containing protein [Rhodanobacteraceae bacterium]